MKTKLKWWTYLIILTPMKVGIWLISQLSFETQVERFNNDPTGVILVGLLIFSVFFGWPIIISMFFKTIRFENENIIVVKYPFRLLTKKYRIKDIVEIKDIEGLYGFGKIMNGIKIRLEDDKFLRLDSRFMTNYYRIENIIKNKAPVGNNVHKK